MMKEHIRPIFTGKATEVETVEETQPNEETKEEKQTVIEITTTEYIKKVSKQTFNILRVINHTSDQAKRQKELYLVMLQNAINDGHMMEFIIGIYAGLTLFLDAPGFSDKVTRQYYVERLLPSANTYLDILQSGANPLIDTII